MAPLAAIPDVTRRLAAILGALAALVARAFLKDIRHVACIVPLWNYIGRTARRFDRVMARLAAGQLHPATPRARTARPPSPRETTPRPPRGYPTNRDWLLAALRHEAAGYGSQLNHLLSEPETAALIAAAPQAARLLRPLCRMLGISPAAIRPTPCPATPSRQPGRRPRHDPPEAAPAPDPAGPRSRPLCPHLLERWPWAAPGSSPPARDRNSTLLRLAGPPLPFPLPG
jgi:hypothetical protein